MGHQDSGTVACLRIDPVFSHHPFPVSGCLYQPLETPVLGGSGSGKLPVISYRSAQLLFIGALSLGAPSGVPVGMAATEMLSLLGHLSVPFGLFSDRPGGLGSHLSIQQSQTMVVYLNGLGCQVIYLLLNQGSEAFKSPWPKRT